MAPTTNWKFPFKPVRMPETAFKAMDLSGYTMERKYDGWRAIVDIGDSPCMWTREKVKIETPDNLAEQLGRLGLPRGTVLDAEIWNPTKRGSWRHDRRVQCMLTVWDVVRAGGREMGREPIEERRRVLADLLGAGTEHVRQVEAVDASLEAYSAILEEAREFREENAIRSGFVHGVVLKRRGSPRRDHATRCVEHPDWLKVVFDGMSGWAPQL